MAKTVSAVQPDQHFRYTSVIWFAYYSIAYGAFRYHVGISNAGIVCTLYEDSRHVDVGTRVSMDYL